MLKRLGGNLGVFFVEQKRSKLSERSRNWELSLISQQVFRDVLRSAMFYAKSNNRRMTS